MAIKFELIVQRWSVGESSHRQTALPNKLSMQLAMKKCDFLGNLIWINARQSVKSSIYSAIRSGEKLDLCKDNKTLRVWLSWRKKLVAYCMFIRLASCYLISICALRYRHKSNKEFVLLRPLSGMGKENGNRCFYYNLMRWLFQITRAISKLQHCSRGT
jgi:hypothetical protein